MRPNKIKQMWRAGQYVTMGWLSISHGFTAEVMARQGFDTLCIDMQHGTTEMNEVWPMRGLPNRLETSQSRRLISASWPQVGEFAEAAEHIFPKLQEIIGSIRNLRNEYKVEPKKKVMVSVIAPSAVE